VNRSIDSKNVRTALFFAVAAFFVFSATAMAQVEQHSQISLQGTALVTKDTNADSSPLSHQATKSGGLLVGYSYQFNSWAGAEGNYGYTQNTQNYMASVGQSIRSDFHEITGAFVAHIPVRVHSVRPYALAGAGALVFNPTDDAKRMTAPSTGRPKPHSYMAAASISISHPTLVSAPSIAASCTRFPTFSSTP